MSSYDIFQEVRVGNVGIYFSDVGDKFSIEVVNEYNENLLHTAIAYDRLNVCIDLIDRGIDVNHQNEDGNTPLHYALEHQSGQIVKAIIDKNVDVNLVNKYGNEPLWTAVFNARGDYDAVKSVLAKGGNPNHKNKHNLSPLDMAIRFADPELIKILKI